jgi:hypothetical protein
MQLQKSAGVIRSRISCVQRSKKSGGVRERGPSAVQSSAVKRRWGYRAKGCRTLDCAGTNGANPAKTQSDVRASFSGCLVRASGGGDRETGVLKATGSYEGSLTTEGTPDHHEPSPFTRRWSRWSRRLPRISTARKIRKRIKTRERLGEGYGEVRSKKEWRQEYQRFFMSGAVGTKRPRSRSRR